MKYFIAGGAVRDMLLGVRPHDIDVSFHGGESKFLKENPGARKIQTPFKKIFIRNRQEFTAIEKNPAYDVLQRDFTINSFLVGPEGILYAHPQSLQDLKKGIIRPSSQKSLKNDPLRFFRAARFTAVFPDFSLSSSCINQMQKLTAEDFESIAAEQIGQEFIKACSADKPGNFLRSIKKTGNFPLWLKELTKAATITAGPAPYHNSSILEHMAQVMDATANFAKKTGYTKHLDSTRCLAVWMAFCHDLGKITTDPKILPHHYAHEQRGVELAEKIALRVRLPKRYKEGGALASCLHMKAGIYEELRIGTKVDLLISANAKNFFIPFFIMASADSDNYKLLDRVSADLEILTQQKIPKKWQNMGAKSGEKLREIRCQALANAYSNKN